MDTYVYTFIYRVYIYIICLHMHVYHIRARKKTVYRSVSRIGHEICAEFPSLSRTWTCHTTPKAWTPVRWGKSALNYGGSGGSSGMQWVHEKNGFAMFHSTWSWAKSKKNLITPLGMFRVPCLISWFSSIAIETKIYGARIPLHLQLTGLLKFEISGVARVEKTGRAQKKICEAVVAQSGNFGPNFPKGDYG